VLEIGVDACCVLNQCALEDEPADPATVCGNGVVEEGELCDDGGDNATYGHCGGRCDGPHLYCGDLRVDPPETCDEGVEGSAMCTARCELRGNDDDGGTDESSGGSGGFVAPPLDPTAGTGAWAGAGSVARPDAGSAVDAGHAPHSDSAGCDCSVPHGASGQRRGASVTALLLAAMAWMRSRTKARSRTAASRKSRA
jgi:hypothetical protein